MRIHGHATRIGGSALALRATLLAAVVAMLATGHARAEVQHVNVVGPAVTAPPPGPPPEAWSTSRPVILVPQPGLGGKLVPATADPCASGAAGYWSGYWTWNNATHSWTWTWVWHWCPGHNQTS